MPHDKYDLIIHNGTAVTVNDRFDIIDHALICVQNGAIVSIRPADKGTVLPRATEVVYAGGGIIMPGLVNTHTHLPMTLFRGLADDLPLDTWQRAYVPRGEPIYYA